MSLAALIAAVGTAVLFGAVFPPLIVDDSNSYLDPAISWAQGNGLRDRLGQPLESRLPAFPIVLGLGHRLFGHDPRAISLINVAFHIAAMFVARQLVRPTNREAADWCAASAIVYPPFLTATATVLQDTLLSFLVALFAWAVVRAVQTDTLRSALAAGAALGLATLGKVVILPLAVPVAVLLALHPRRVPERGAAFLLAAATVLAPWAVRNKIVLGRFEVTNNNGGHALLGGTVSNNIEDWQQFPEYLAAVDQWTSGERLKQPVLDRYLYQAALQRITADPMRWARLIAERSLRFMLPSRHWMAAMGLTTPGTLSPLFLAGAVLQALAFGAAALLLLDGARRRLPVSLLIPPAIVFWHLAVYALVYASPRYNIGVGPLLASSATLWWYRRGA